LLDNNVATSTQTSRSFPLLPDISHGLLGLAAVECNI
jgi:hypothetical protein